MKEVISTTESMAWNYRHLGAALFVGLTLQGLLLPCLCQIGQAKMGFAFAFDAAMIARILVAYYRKESGRGWVFYAALLYSSALWIEGLTYVLFGET